MYSTWKDQADDAIINEFNDKFFNAINEQAKASGLQYDFTYLNDSPEKVRPFDAYGGGASLPKLKAIAKKYGG